MDLGKIEEQVRAKSRKMHLDAHQREVYRNMLVRQAREDEKWGEKSLADYVYGLDDEFISNNY